MINVDDAEIRKFEALAARWWDPNSEFKPLHEINPLRMNYISRHVNLAEKRVLDVGCGGGILAEAMAHHGASVTAIDKAEASLAVARLHLLESKLDIDYRNISAEELAAEQAKEQVAEKATETAAEQVTKQTAERVTEQTGSFDVVCCLEMLEHVPDPASVVNACQQLLKPGGWVFFSTINRNPKSYLFAIVGAEYVLNLLPRGTHDYDKFIRPSELAAWCRQSGLNLQGQTGMGYNPFSKRYFLQDSLDVNYIAAWQRPVLS